MKFNIALVNIRHRINMPLAPILGKRCIQGKQVPRIRDRRFALAKLEKSRGGSIFIIPGGRTTKGKWPGFPFLYDPSWDRVSRL